MTKEQIIKHKDVIKWFIDNPDKGVFRKDTPTNDWYLDLEPSFYEDYIYLQNDEYAKFRKALVDGKIVQHNFHSDCAPKYRDVYETVNKIVKSIPASCYRIKPKDYEFNDGEWVHITYKQGISELREFKESMNEWTNVHSITDWKPTKGELCVFWDNKIKYGYIVSKFYGNYYDDGDLKFLNMKGYFYENIAPIEFIDYIRE
jgi:hypothetical protein